MAVIKFGSIVTDGRGSLGGSTIQSDRSGHIWRNKPLPLKSRSPAQSLIRSYNKAMQAGWRALSESDKRIWNDYPKINHIFNKSGEKHPLSGHSLWMKYQYQYLSQQFALQPDPVKASVGPLGPEMFLDPDIVNPVLWTLQLGTTISNGLFFSNIGAYRIAIAPISPLYTGLTYRFDIHYVSPFPGTRMIFYNQATVPFIDGWGPATYPITSARMVHDGLLVLDATAIWMVGSHPFALGFTMDSVSIRQILP